jgi:hypothetical protein
MLRRNSFRLGLRTAMGLIIFLSVICSALIQSGCYSTATPTPPPCNPAIACATVNLESNPLCLAYKDRPFFRAGNLHPSRSIFVTYRIDGVALNPPPPSPASSYTSRLVKPGDDVDLGCKYTEPTPGTGSYVLYTYTPVSACFTDDSTCKPAAPITPSDAPKNCSKQTHCVGPDCIYYQFDSVPGDPLEAQARLEADKAIQDTLSSASLTSVNLTGLLAIRTLCPGRGNVAIQGGNFTEDTGSTCQVYLKVRPSPNLYLRVTLPPKLDGKFARTPNLSAAFDFPDASFSPNFEWFDDTGSLGNENVARIELSTGLVKIIGSRHYCIWLRTKKP